MSCSCSLNCTADPLTLDMPNPPACDPSVPTGTFTLVSGGAGTAESCNWTLTVGAYTFTASLFCSGGLWIWQLQLTGSGGCGPIAWTSGGTSVPTLPATLGTGFGVQPTFSGTAPTTNCAGGKVFKFPVCGSAQSATCCCQGVNPYCQVCSGETPAQMTVNIPCLGSFTLDYDAAGNRFAGLTDGCPCNSGCDTTCCSVIWSACFDSPLSPAGSKLIVILYATLVTNNTLSPTDPRYQFPWILVEVRHLSTSCSGTLLGWAWFGSGQPTTGSPSVPAYSNCAQAQGFSPWPCYPCIATAAEVAVASRDCTAGWTLKYETDGSQCSAGQACFFSNNSGDPICGCSVGFCGGESFAAFNETITVTIG